MTAPTQPGPEPGISRDRMAALVAACGLSLTFGSFTLAAGCGGSAFSAGSDEPDGQAAAALEVKGASGAQTLVLETFPRLDARPTKIRLEFDLRIDSPGSVGAFSAAGFAAIAYGTGVADGYVALAIGNDFGNVLAGAWAIADGSAAGDAGSYATSSSSTAFPSSGTWAGRFAIEIDYDASGGACLQGYRGPTPLLTSCMPLPPSLGNPGVVSIALGDYAAGLGNTGEIDLEFDDVTYDVSP